MIIVGLVTICSYILGGESRVTFGKGRERRARFEREDEDILYSLY